MTSTGTQPIVLISPAMAIGSGYYRPLVEELRSRGWEARALPRRGFEPNQPTASRSVDWSYADEVDDTAAAVAEARAEDPSRPVLILGHSLGGQFATGHELTRTPADGVITVGGVLPHYRHYSHGGWPIWFLATALIPLMTRVFGYLPEPAFGAPGARTLMREWARLIRTGELPFPAGDPITTPALLISLDGDQLGPAAGVDGLAGLYDPSSRTRWHYADSEVPEGASNDHVTWVRSPARVVDEIVSWWARVE
ncbi:MAG: alpha/beta hydrolase [Actinomycetia bacterium]|nr:alpha/beta hydrolase [Actinomycetes bacterium]